MNSQILKRKQDFRRFITLGKDKGVVDYNNINNLLSNKSLTKSNIELITTALKVFNIKLSNHSQKSIKMQILDIVKSSGLDGIKAKDIVKKFNTSITKKEVNKALYGCLKNHVKHNDLYKWSVKK